MRLSLMLSLGLLCSSCREPLQSLSRKPGEVTLHAGYYRDNDQVEVWQPGVRFRVPLHRRVQVHGAYSVDAISAASVDIVASASRVIEQRHEFRGGVDLSINENTTIGSTYRGSREPDYQSDGLAMQVEHENDARTRSLRFEVRARRDLVGPGWNFLSAQPYGNFAGAASITQVLDRRSLLRIGAIAEAGVGTQWSPYRYLWMQGAAYPERTPEFRFRSGAGVRYQRALVSTLALFAEYELQGDTWNVWQQTATVGLRWDVLPWLLLEARTLGSYRTAAFFYSSTYNVAQQWRTRDRSLVQGTSLWPQVSARVALPGWPATASWEWGTSAGMLWQHYEDYPWLPDRFAFVAESWIRKLF